MARVRKYSVVIPVYRNEGSLDRLIEALGRIDAALDGQLEAVFVVDGSPDRCFELLRDALPGLSFSAQVLAHSRNFGSFPAIRTGLAAARGEYFAVMAADLQEPPGLLLAFFEALREDQCDVAVGARTSRDDPLFSRLASRCFWALYRRYISPEMPEGGVDVFACNRKFRGELLALEESRSSLVALIFWLGFRRQVFPYQRLARQDGKSAWTLGKKLDYLWDSVFAFTDYPIRLLMRIGALGSLASVAFGVTVVAARMLGAIEVPGYAATMIAVLALGALNLFGLGMVGTYAWRAYENSKRRPLAVVAARHRNFEE